MQQAKNRRKFYCIAQVLIFSSSALCLLLNGRFKSTWRKNMSPLEIVF